MLDITLSGRKLQGRYGNPAATPAEPHGAPTGVLCYPICMRLLALLLLPALSFAQVPHTFQNGDVADAEKINENFDALTDDIAAAYRELSSDQITSVSVDCSSDATNFNTAFLKYASSRNLELSVTGTCLLDEATASWRLKHRRLWIKGDPNSPASLVAPDRISFYAELATQLILSDVTLASPSVEVYARNGSSGGVYDVVLSGYDGELPSSSKVVAAINSDMGVRYTGSRKSLWGSISASTNSRVTFRGGIDAAVKPYLSAFSSSVMILHAYGEAVALECRGASSCTGANPVGITGGNEPLVIDNLLISLNSIFLSKFTSDCDTYDYDWIPASVNNSIIHSGGSHYLSDACNYYAPPQLIQ